MKDSQIPKKGKAKLYFNGDALTHERLSGLGMATPFTSSNVEYRGKIAIAVLITVELASIRFTMHGVAPTSDYGHWKSVV